MTVQDLVLAGSYDYRWVTVSVVIAVTASNPALDLAGRVTAARGWVRLAWLIGGTTAMGTGIWSMHYTGMLAFSLSIPTEYHWLTVLLSLPAGILSSAFALVVVSRGRMGALRWEGKIPQFQHENTIRGVPGGGTTVRVRIPCAEPRTAGMAK